MNNTNFQNALNSAFQRGKAAYTVRDMNGLFLGRLEVDPENYTVMVYNRNCDSVMLSASNDADIAWLASAVEALVGDLCDKLIAEINKRE